MYLVDFFKRMTRKSNIPVVIYLVLNIFIISGIISILFSDSAMPFWKSLLLGIILYVISLVVALSPIGELILRIQTGCRKIQRVEQINYIEPIFREVYDKAKKLDSSIPDDVQLFMNDDDAPNAFATGRKTICITKGMFSIPPEQIKATLAHEFGHLAHKDTDLILVVSVGNMIVTAIIVGIRLAIDLFHIFFSICSLALGGTEGVVAAVVNTIYHLAITAIVAGLTKLWTWVGAMLVMKSSRSNEYEADEFAFNLGYGNEICILLDAIDGSGAKGLFATLVSSHPRKDDRIARLQELGSTYRAGFVGVNNVKSNAVTKSVQTGNYKQRPTVGISE